MKSNTTKSTRKPYLTKNKRDILKLKQDKEDEKKIIAAKKLEKSKIEELKDNLKNSDYKSVIKSISSLRRIGYKGTENEIIKTLYGNDKEIQKCIDNFNEWNNSKKEEKERKNKEEQHITINNTFIINITNINGNTESCNHELSIFARNIFCELSKCIKCGYVDRTKV